MKIETGVVDQHDEIPAFSLDQCPDTRNPLQHRFDGRQADEPHHIQLGNVSHQFRAGRPHRRAADTHNLKGGGQLLERLDQVGSMEVAGSLSGDD